MSLSNWFVVLLVYDIHTHMAWIGLAWLGLVNQAHMHSQRFNVATRYQGNTHRKQQERKKKNKENKLKNNNNTR